MQKENPNPSTNPPRPVSKLFSWIHQIWSEREVNEGGDTGYLTVSEIDTAIYNKHCDDDIVFNPKPYKLKSSKFLLLLKQLDLK